MTTLTKKIYYNKL